MKTKKGYFQTHSHSPEKILEKMRASIGVEYFPALCFKRWLLAGGHKIEAGASVHVNFYPPNRVAGVGNSGGPK